MFVDFNILNQLGSPSINSNTFANRPAAGQTGRLFVSTDTFEIYRDNGTTWDLIGGPGSSTITGTGTATQVAYFTSSQAIGSSANLFWDNTNTRLGIGTATPGAALDIHSTGIMAHFNTTSATGNTYIAFQRTGTNVWRLGDQYNAGANFFQIHNTALSNNAIEIATATNKSIFTALQTYTTGLARGNYFDYNLSVSAGGSFSSPNAITALGASLDLTLAGSATIPSGARSGLDAYNSISFTGAGTLTHNQGSQIRAYSNVTAGWAFNGSATGTVTHLAGLRALFPDNTGSAINVTNNYALLLNDQTPNTGTVTYTNRWGVYQEGASDLNYMAANLLLGSTTNNGLKLQVTGESYFSSNVGLGVSPSAWGTNDKAIEIGGSNSSTYTGLNVTSLGKNTYYDGSNWIYKQSSVHSTLYQQSFLGNHIWYLGGTGTAGNAISFTQAMTLTAAGRLLLGTATEGSYQLDINANGYRTFRIQGNDDVIMTIGSTIASSQNWTFGATSNGSVQGSNLFFIGTSTNNPSGALTKNFQIASTGAATFSLSVTTGDYIRLPLDTYLQSSDGSGGWIELIKGSGINTVVNNNKNGAIIFNQSSGSGETMRITSGGNTLIGTTTDAGQKLQVSGDIYLFNSINGGILTSTSGKALIASSGETQLLLEHTVISGVTYNLAYFLTSSTGDPMLFKGEVREDGTNAIVTLGDITSYDNGTTFRIDDAASTISTSSSNIDFNGLTSSASAGSLVGYITIKLNGTSYKIPYYNL